ncbi:MAG: hypothetical protein ABEH47_06495 [Haloferacaceae archaeon]
MLRQPRRAGGTRRGPLSALGVAGPFERTRHAPDEGTDATSAAGRGEAAGTAGVVVG